jgi:predicted MFS family arabinose efflux permease
MNASVKWVMLVGMPLGAVVGAVIADTFGLRAALFAGAVGIIVAPIPLLLSGISSVVRQPEHAEE